MSVDTDSHQHGYISDKERYLGRMKRIEGQARGIACVLDAAKLSDEAAVEKIQEATDAINRLVRS
ncbi:MAG: hypothetical protein DI630_14600 [Gordonia sp. (in: high G+C Gram-positive bacteria)]|nr:MAG: hypothetical protein DI630_14600 [Gordonia sp. (in: high G+C Gram-positive bacteria)]